MASIVKRRSRYCVVYNYVDEHGVKKQKWETYKTKADAEKRRHDIEHAKRTGTFSVKPCETFEELSQEYIEVYGKNQWALSTYHRNIALMDNYILPVLGKIKLSDFTSRMIEQYYRSLLDTDVVPPMRFGQRSEIPTGKKVSPGTIRDIHKLISSCFKQAVKWELMEKNPCANATKPKVEKNERDIWTIQDLQRALEVCEDARLKLAINLAFSCTLRLGEMLGLTWDCINVSEDMMRAGTPYIRIEKELQRVDKTALKALDKKDVIFEFPQTRTKSLTTIVLKTPKTRTSIRTVYLPLSAAKMLIEWKERQEKAKEALGEEYTDYGLVFTGPFGGPLENGTINDGLRRLIQEHDLPKVVFHSLRHSSITYKLKLNGGDIKAVQGDSGHAQATMVTERYSHVLADGQQANAELIEKYFYGKTPIPERQGMENASTLPQNGAESLEMLTKLLTNPETAALLKTLAATLGNK